MKAISQQIIIDSKLMDILIERSAITMKAGNMEKESLSYADCVINTRDFFKDQGLQPKLEMIMAQAIKAGFVTGVNLSLVGKKRKIRRIFKKYFNFNNKRIESLIGDIEQLKNLGL